MPSTHRFASLLELERLAKADPLRVASLLGETILVDDVEGIMERATLIVLAGQNPYTQFHVRWQDEPQ